MEHTIQGRHGDTDKVHQVVTGKGHSQGKGTDHDDYLEDVDLEGVEELHEHGAHHEDDAKEHQRVLIEEGLDFGGHERGTLHALEEHEVDDGGHGHTTEDTDFLGQSLLIIIGKYKACYPLHDDAEKEGYRHGEEDTGYHLQCLARVEQVADALYARQIFS